MSRKVHRVCNNGLLAIVLLGLILSIQIQAQAPTATLSGQVRDESGAPVPGAVITVTAAADGAVSRTTAAAEGRFEIRSLAPGRYSVVGEQPGLLPAVIPEVVLAPGGSRSVILELKVPGISEVVSVGATLCAFPKRRRRSSTWPRSS